jgi:hypothetical protein
MRCEPINLMTRELMGMGLMHGEPMNQPTQGNGFEAAVETGT